LLSVINDILDMSKIEAGRLELEPEALDMAELIAESIRITRGPAEERSITIHTDLGTGLSLAADRRALKQILLNLMSNAVKFTPDSGRVTVRARSDGEMVSVEIEDTGIGIPRDALEKLGRPFEQGQNQFAKNHKGSGLGLAIARSRAELHGRSMTIRSSEGVGTIVTVRLPVQPAMALEPEAA